MFVSYDDFVLIAKEKGWTSENDFLLTGLTAQAVHKKFLKLKKQDKMLFIEFNYDKNEDSYHVKFDKEYTKNLLN